MKILFVVQNYHPSVGGTQALFKILAEHCATTYQDEVSVYTTDSYFGPEKLNFKKVQIDSEVINGILVKRFPFIRRHLFIGTFFKKIMLRLRLPIPEKFSNYFFGPWSPKLRKAIASSDADVIVAGTSNYLYMLYPLYRNNYKNPKPFVFMGAIHFREDSTVKVLSDKALEAIKASEFYMANTAYEKLRLVECGVDADAIVVGGSMVNVNQYINGDGSFYRNRFNLPRTAILIGYIGRIEPAKSIDILLQAFELAFQSNPALHLVVAGRASNANAERLQASIKAINRQSGGQVHTVFNLIHEEKVNLYHALDVFVLPSLNESFGMVFLEAWSCGKPVIGMNIGAIRAVIEDQADGLLAEPGNADSLAEKISMLADDERIRNRLGAAGYLKAKQQYNKQVVVETYHDTFLKAKEKFDVQRRS